MRKKNEDDSAQVGLRVPVDLLARLDAMAEQQSRTRTGQIIWMLRRTYGDERTDDDVKS